MFTKQSGQITNALVAAGLAPSAASAIARILGNPSQPLAHSGPQTQDNTHPAMRMVTPDARKQLLTNLDFRQGDPDYRTPLVAAGEARPTAQPEPTVLTSTAPQQRDAPFRVQGGAYTTTQGRGEDVSVGLRLSGSGEAAFIDPQSNSFVAKNLRAECDASGDGMLRFFIDRVGEEVVWKLQLQNVSTVNVVTGIEYVAGQGLVVTYGTLTAWTNPRSEPRTEIIPVQDISVVTDIALEDDGLTARKAGVTVFSSAVSQPAVVATTDCPTT